MANGSTRSRSSMRALEGVHVHRDDGVSRSLSWAEPEQREIARPTAAKIVDVPDLTCPDCGCAVRLTLFPVAPQTTQHPVPVLRSAPEPATGETDFEESIRRHKRELVKRALDANGGVMTRAAKALGLKYTTFVAMVHRLDAVASEGERARQ